MNSYPKSINEFKALSLRDRLEFISILFKTYLPKIGEIEKNEIVKEYLRLKTILQEAHSLLIINKDLEAKERADKAIRELKTDDLDASQSKRKRFFIFNRDNFTCQYCGRKAPEVVLELDHKKPLSTGGLDVLDNLITACQECNRGKSNLVDTTDFSGGKGNDITSA